MDNAPDPEVRLSQLREQVQQCQRCPLGASRTNAVFGAGSSFSKVMFVGEAPGYHEDQQGLPFVGQAGKLLEKLLSRIGLTRADVYIANVLKCRPPGNRDPQPEEITRCREYLEEQIDIIRPAAICTMGNFSTKLLSGNADGITRVRGMAQPYPGNGEISLFPVFHPAAALYTPANLATLEKDFDNLGKIIGLTESKSELESFEKERPIPEAGVEGTPHTSAGQAEPEQLGLF